MGHTGEAALSIRFEHGINRQNKTTGRSNIPGSAFGSNARFGGPPKSWHSASLPHQPPL